MRELTLEHDVIIELAQGLLANGTGIWLTVTGDSMRPVIRPGDQVLLEPVAGRGVKIKKGEILAYRGGVDSLVIHRVVAVDTVSGSGEYKLLLRGDGYAAGQEWIGQSQIIGAVRMMRRGEDVVRVNSSRAQVKAWLIRVKNRFVVQVGNRLQKA